MKIFTNFAVMRKIHYLFNHIVLLVSLALLTACGNDEEFVINCEIRGLGSKGVEMYYTMRGVQRASFHPVDGKVVLRGVSAEPTMVDVFTLDNEPLFSCVVRNGDELKVKMDLEKPGVIEIKGNDASEQYAKFVTDNDSLLRSDDVAAVNRLIADEVRLHPERISSAMLLVRYFDARGYELQADSLINLLTPAARPQWVVGAYPGLVGEQVSTAARGGIKPMTLRHGRVDGEDTIVRYWPSSQSYSMLVFTGGYKADSLRRALRSLVKDLPKRRFTILELNVIADSAHWVSSLSGDSAKWMQGWLPGGVGNPAVRAIHVPTVPFFIVADSLGRQVYRGRSLTAADDTVRHRLARFLGSADEAEGDTAALKFKAPEAESPAEATEAASRAQRLKAGARRPGMRPERQRER